jgi:hypothetical protein
MLQPTLPAGFITPCLPTKTDELPSGSQATGFFFVGAPGTIPIGRIACLTLNWAVLSALAANSSLPIRRTIVGHLREVTTMIDFRTAKILGHRRNIQRYARLLAGELTELERQYLHKRIAEEQAELEQLQESQPQQAGVLIAAEDMGKGSGKQSKV